MSGRSLLTMWAILLSFLSACSAAPTSGSTDAAFNNRIVVLGDSHLVGPMGVKLDQLLRTLPDTAVNFYGSCGTIAKTWTTAKGTKCGAFEHTQGSVERIEKNAQTPQLFTKWKNLDDRIVPGIFTANPTHVIVEFGANYWDYNEVFIETDLENLLTNIEKTKAKCFFITMPDTRLPKIRVKQELIVKKIRDVTANRCAVFDSTDPKVTQYPPTDPEGTTYDGVHYNKGALIPLGEAWAEAAFLEFSDFMKK